MFGARDGDQGHDRRASASRKPRSSRSLVPSGEGLEGRLLLSVLPPNRRIVQRGGVFDLNLSGPGGMMIRHAGNKQIDLVLVGTTEASQVSVNRVNALATAIDPTLSIRNVVVRTGRLGSIMAADSASLGGSMNLRGNVSTLQFAGLGPETRVQVDGNLGGLLVTGDAALGPRGFVRVTRDLTGPIQVQGDLRIDQGLVQVGRDMQSVLQVQGGMEVTDSGSFVVGRDMGAILVQGNVILGTNGRIAVGRDLGQLRVEGDLDSSANGLVQVEGNLGLILVQGSYRGDASGDARIGLSLGLLDVRGARPNEGSVYRVDLDVAKSIEGLNLTHGLYDSFVSAGILIIGNANSSSSSATQIGPDGPIAIRDSELRAGVAILDLRVNGDVVSTTPSKKMRIVAGLNRAGVANATGLIDRFQILGSLVNAVVAANVLPDGSGLPGAGTYDAPAGVLNLGTIVSPILVPNATAPPFNTTLDPVIDDVVLAGAVNPTFSTGTVPTVFTVTGAVISTITAGQGDFAGIFASNTSGVRVGSTNYPPPTP